MQSCIGKPFLVCFEHAGVTARTSRRRALAERSRLYVVSAVAARANWRITIRGIASGFRMHAAEIGRENLLVAILAGDLVEFGRRILDDCVRAMTVRAYRRRRVAAANQRGVNAAFPLCELVGMAALARLGRSNCIACLLYTSPSPRDGLLSRMP